MAETTPVEEMPLGMLIAWLSVFLAVVLFGVALPVIDVRWVVPFVVFAAVLFTGAFAGPLTSAMASFPCRSASVRPACPLTNVSHHSSAEQDEYAGLWVMPLRLLNADFRFWSRFRGGFLPSRVLGWSTTTTMVRVTRYKEWNFICRRCLEPMVFEDWPIGI